MLLKYGVGKGGAGTCSAETLSAVTLGAEIPGYQNTSYDNKSKPAEPKLFLFDLNIKSITNLSTSMYVHES